MKAFVIMKSPFLFMVCSIESVANSFIITANYKLQT